MPRKPKLDTSIKEIMIVEDPAAIKLLFTPKYAEIIKLVDAEELSVSDVARKLGVNPGSAHYHMKELEKHGLVQAGEGRDRRRRGQEILPQVRPPLHDQRLEPPERPGARRGRHR